jgi:hypothetical protein
MPKKNMAEEQPVKTLSKIKVVTITKENMARLKNIQLDIGNVSLLYPIEVETAEIIGIIEEGDTLRVSINGNNKMFAIDKSKDDKTFSEIIKNKKEESHGA